MRISRQITKGGSLADSAWPRRGRSGRMAHVLGGLLALVIVSLSGGCKDAAQRGYKSTARARQTGAKQTGEALCQDIGR
jgi:hypothetical protein